MPVKQISLGGSHSVALTVNGSVYSWGYGGDGRLGHGDEYDQLIPRRLEYLSDKNISQVIILYCYSLLTFSWLFNNLSWCIISYFGIFN